MNQIIKSDIVMPAVSSKEALDAWKLYQDLKNKIVDKKVDVQVIGNKEFLKKSYWRKVATFFNLTVESVSEGHEQIGKTIVWHFTVRAKAPNGRSAIGVGSCDAYEKAILVNGIYMREDKSKVIEWGTSQSGKKFPKKFEMIPATPNSIHNIRSTAETRAFNRAVSNLVGGGEVSAEEVDSGNGPTVDHGEVIKTPEKNTSPADQVEHFCHIHKKPLKDRGEGIWDHRNKINGLWAWCQGKGWNTSSVQEKEKEGSS